MLFVDPTGPGAGEGVPELLGLPMPANGSRTMSSSNRLIRLSIERSVDCQKV